MVTRGVEVVTHIVIFTWVAGATPDRVDDLGRAFDRLALEMSGSVKITHGPDLRFRAGNGDYALIAEFADRAGWDSYQADSRHRALVRDLVAPIQASRMTIQLQSGE